MRYLITEPQDGFQYEPSVEDWNEFFEYVREMDSRQIMEEEFDEANAELLEIANEATPW